MRGLFGVLAILGNLGIGVFCLGLGLLGWLTGGDMVVPLVPVQGEHVAASLASAGCFAIVASLLALKSKTLLRLPMLLWSLGLSAVLIAAIFRSGYHFDGIEGLQRHGWMLLTSMILLWGSWSRIQTSRRRRMVLYRGR